MPTNVVNYRPGSDDLDTLLAGWVDARRINDIVAKRDSKRYRRYLSSVQGRFINPNILDPEDAWREKELAPRALDAYEQKHGVELQTGRLFTLPDFRIAAAPDAIECRNGKQFGWGITVHIRQTLETYQDAIKLGVTPDMERHAQAMMYVTGCDAWIHLQYFEDGQTRQRKLREQEVLPYPQQQESLAEAMIGFYSRTRLRAAT